MLYFLRHGETEWNYLNMVQGRIDISLNKSGKEQARNTAAKVCNVDFDYIYASPLSRVLETCEIVTNVKRKNYILDDRLLEREYGELQGTVFDYEKRKEICLWKLDDCAVEKVKGLESLKSLKERVFAFLDEVIPLAKEKNVLIASHYGVGTMVEMYFKGEPKSGDLSEYKIFNAELRCYEIKD